jgi:transposase-like protein
MPSFTINDRRTFTAFQKVAILKEHLLEKMPVSEVCRKHDLQPTQFYKWQKQFFENGAKAFEVAPAKPKSEPWQVRINELEEKLTRKNEVVSELMETHLKLKKSLGER